MCFEQVSRRKGGATSFTAKGIVFLKGKMGLATMRCHLLIGIELSTALQTFRISLSRHRQGLSLHLRVRNVGGLSLTKGLSERDQGCERLAAAPKAFQPNRLLSAKQDPPGI